MAHAESDVVIDRPIRDVFDYLAHAENNIRWRGRILTVERTSEQVGLDATYRQVISGRKGRTVRHDFRVTRFEPPTRLEFQHLVGLARPTGRFELTAYGGDRTRVRFELDWQPRGVKRILNKMIETWMADEVVRLDDLKRLLDT